MAKPKKVYKWYLILAIIYSSITVLSLLLYFASGLRIITAPSAIVQELWFVFSIVMLIVFIVNKIERVAIWLPTLYILNEIFAYITGYITGYWGLPIPAALQIPVLNISFAIIPIVILIFAIKLLIRK